MLYKTQRISIKWILKQYLSVDDASALHDRVPAWASNIDTESSTPRHHAGVPIVIVNVVPDAFSECRGWQVAVMVGMRPRKREEVAGKGRRSERSGGAKVSGC
jgi:hypothetical protein